MINFMAFRHGESDANAGSATTDPATIALTETGHRQAQNLADAFFLRPDLIVVSPFLRAQQTAAPLMAKFADVPVETWPIHEFTYLSPAKCSGMTVATRRPMVEAYWHRADTDYVDGEGAESFAQLMERVFDTQQRLASLAGTGIHNVAMVGHGQFLQALRAVMDGTIPDVSSKTMQLFRQLEHTQAIRNTAGFTAAWDGETWQNVTPLPAP